MFSLIISIIAIALVVALAGSTLYYGGDAFSKGSAKATASKFVNQGQQMAAAHTLYKNDNGGSPLTNTTGLSPLTAGDYLSALPAAHAGTWDILDTVDMTDGHADGLQKALVVHGAGISDEVCAEVVAQAGTATGVFTCLQVEDQPLALVAFGTFADDGDPSNDVNAIVYAL